MQPRCGREGQYFDSARGAMVETCGQILCNGDGCLIAVVFLTGRLGKTNVTTRSEPSHVHRAENNFPEMNQTPT